MWRRAWGSTGSWPRSSSKRNRSLPMNLDRKSGAEAHALHTLRDVEGVRRGEAFGVRRFTGALGSWAPSSSKRNRWLPMNRTADLQVGPQPAGKPAVQRSGVPGAFLRPWRLPLNRHPFGAWNSFRPTAVTPTLPRTEVRTPGHRSFKGATHDKLLVIKSLYDC